MGNDKEPCCAADALRRIRQVTINGLPTGIAMLDACIAEVKAQELANEAEIRAVLLKRVKVYNYVPLKVEEEYARALFEEYRRSSVQKEANHGRYMTNGAH